MNALPDDLATHPAAVRVRKLPVAVTARRMNASGTWQTLEGPVAYAAGDMLLTGVAGEQWPVTQARFAATYEAIAPTIDGMDGQYRKRPLDVYALRLEQPLDIASDAGRKQLHGGPGDWLLQYGTGDFGIVAAAIFPQTYQLVGPHPHGQ